MSTAATLGLVLKNDSSELGRLAEAVDEFSERHELPAEARFELQLCLEELVLNVVNYGFDAPGEHDIRVDLEVGGEPRVLTSASWTTAASSTPSPTPRSPIWMRASKTVR